MNISRKKYCLNYICLLTLILFSSCDKVQDPDPGGTTTEKFAGDWHIAIFDTNGDQVVDYGLYSTYNAASNDENFWIDDHDEIVGLKTKVQVNDFKNLTFNGLPDSDELYYGGTVTVSNGKIMKKAAQSFGGHTVDSIYFEAEFDWEPDVIYQFKGHKRTGFIEDEL